MADAPYQSLYRRYRPQRFSETLGQDHITKALRNAVRDERVAHAYLFSGPRGTGKTSTARILAKALNCTKLDDGEPCGICESCQSIQLGTSYDVIELDAASNRGIDRMRSLLEGVALGSGGRRKVYIVDEVHMLTAEASAALLKTLEEPPSHVVFVLATTDPQKVLPTIRSRVQHYEFRLFPVDVLTELLRSINTDAGLGLEAGSLEIVARRGAGSARDALSALEQAAALGAVEDDDRLVDDVLEAVCEHEPGHALVAVAKACAHGRDARRLAEDLLEGLRHAFLAVMAPELVALPGDGVARAEDQGRRMGTATVVRAMEAVGEALSDMKDALDPRVLLEVALVRVCKPDVDPSPAALLARIEKLEQQRLPAATPKAGAAPTKGTLGALRARPTPQPDTPPAPQAPAAPEVAGSGDAADMPSRDELTLAWGDTILGALPQRPRARFNAGRFTAAADGVAVFALPNQIHRDRCEECRSEVEVALSTHFGTKIALKLVVDDGADSRKAAAAPEPERIPTPDELTDAPADVTSPEERVRRAFPDAEEVDPA